MTDRNVEKAWGSELHELGATPAANLFVLPPGEDQKTLATVERLCRRWIVNGVERGDTIVACGGGVIGDIAGFSAACYQRGISFIQVPTTLLSMVDASVGGKTGVDLPEGKNLIGAFHQPLFVLVDIDFLKTLPPHRLIDGYAEVLKTALIGDLTLFDFLKSGGQQQILKGEPQALFKAVTACVQFKANVVAKDEKETDLRRILNFGHTVGHALETSGGFQQLSHGEAVLWGLCAAIELSMFTGTLIIDKGGEIQLLLQPLLEHIPALDFDPQALYQLLLHDKKVLDGIPHWVLLEEVGKPVIRKDVSQPQILEVLGRLKLKMGRL